MAGEGHTVVTVEADLSNEQVGAYMSKFNFRFNEECEEFTLKIESKATPGLFKVTMADKVVYEFHSESNQQGDSIEHQIMQPSLLCFKCRQYSHKQRAQVAERILRNQ